MKGLSNLFLKGPFRESMVFKMQSRPHVKTQFVKAFDVTREIHVYWQVPQYIISEDRENTALTTQFNSFQLCYWINRTPASFQRMIVCVLYHIPRYCHPIKMQCIAYVGNLMINGDITACMERACIYNI